MLIRYDVYHLSYSNKRKGNLIIFMIFGHEMKIWKNNKTWRHWNKCEGITIIIKIQFQEENEFPDTKISKNLVTFITY